MTAAASRAAAVEPLGERAAWLLARAARLMAEKGYHHTSMRDVSRATRTSLAGLYHYFVGKEELLYEIQHRTFASLLQEQRRIAGEGGPREAQLERLVKSHLGYFTRHAAELKVCTFELSSLRGEQYRRVARLRQDYYQLLADVVRGLLGPGASPREVRHVTLFLFGSLNWIFMWFDPARDEPADRLGDELVRMALHGLGSWARKARPRRLRRAG